MRMKAAEYLGTKTPKRNKYNARKVTVDGITFDSAKEARRWGELQILEKAGEISHLERQGKIYLMSGNTHLLGESGRKLYYRFDFAYFCPRRNKRVIEDAKGMKTDVYKLKKAILIASYPGIVIEEV